VLGVDASEATICRAFACAGRQSTGSADMERYRSDSISSTALPKSARSSASPARLLAENCVFSDSPGVTARAGAKLSGRMRVFAEAKSS
jgi:hypothetical protein